MSAALLQALAGVIDPELRLAITELDMVESAEIIAGTANVKIKLTIVGCPASDRIKHDAEQAAFSVDGVTAVNVELGVMTQVERDALKEKLRAGKPIRFNPFGADTLTRVFLIGSGKGGVGKSSLTANLAVALATRGHKVGLVDADIFGFSIPGQLGITSKPTKVDEMILPPIFEVDGRGSLKIISIGMFLDGNKPVAWRGPMLHRAIEQFLTDVFWGDLDFLLVDLPPGTGDVAISLGQLLPTASTIVVTTPQVAAAEVAERSGSVGLQTGQSVFGVIENMSWLEQAGERIELFGSGGGQEVANRLAALSGASVPVLGQVPISIELREGSDNGKPIVLSDANDPAARVIGEIADKMAAQRLGLQGKNLKLNL